MPETLVTAPMPCKVISVVAKVGDKVQENQKILTIEAMKVEMPLVAPVAGTLTEIKVNPGQTVEADQVLAVIQ
jgi:biotin carboxyl carrier protein